MSSSLQDEITIRSGPHKSTIDVQKNLPINLLRKAIRERRNAGIAVASSSPTNERRRHRRQHRKEHSSNINRNDEYDGIVQRTEEELRRILTSSDILPDIPYDCTEVELLGEIAFAQGTATTIYIQRDGLSTLNIALPQRNPTIANLKRAIEIVSRAQLQRELRERYEERQQRRRRCQQHAVPTETTTGGITADLNSTLATTTTTTETMELEHETAAKSETTTKAVSTSTPAMALSMLAHTMKGTGELVYSTACSGHQHRSNVSWRFLWRAYALYDLNTNQPLDDRDGSKLLSEYGIENGNTLKFCNREKYFGRRRQ